MLITRECDYAVRILRALSGGETVSVQDICRKENITVSIAYKLARKLEKSGYIRSHRGSSGGYSLKKDLREITLYDVCRAVDKELLLTECTVRGHRCSQNTEATPCMVHKEFCRLQEMITRELKGRSLMEILEG
ncbi:Rrf2 family transcriptional regulator [Lacrimispora sp. NSJ-141]|uniref:Rrf2 family transcriptional regulator n=1 Tax=Lientehia hominis TaxID=2897778 RepID=A0AAP2RK62_9FIRM|nr:Rrf2 family transcriptional regulator [Lientehia hominis]MCD2492405.1 Rrf2 family transcriptional regulator [Lientehia hominis]